MTVDLLEQRLRELDIEAPDAGRISARVLTRPSQRPRPRFERLVSVPVALALLVVLIAYFVPAADLAIADKAPWSGEILKWAGLVGAKDRITVVNASATSSGYTFTLHGVYADSNRTVLLLHSAPAAMPNGYSTVVTDQFARSYRFRSNALNTDSGDMAMQFEPLAWPDSITGARITLHITSVEEPPATATTRGSWEMTATLAVDVARSLAAPAPGDLGPAHVRFTSASYTPATIEVDGQISGVSSTELDRIVPDGAKGEPALQMLLFDPAGQIINGESSSSGDLSTTEFRLVGFRTGGPGQYTLRISYYGYGSFDRTLTIPG